MYAHFRTAFGLHGFSGAHAVERSLMGIRRICERAGLEHRDVRLLRGIARQLAWALRHPRQVVYCRGSTTPVVFWHFWLQCGSLSPSHPPSRAGSTPDAAANRGSRSPSRLGKKSPAGAQGIDQHSYATPEQAEPCDEPKGEPVYLSDARRRRHENTAPLRVSRGVPARGRTSGQARPRPSPPSAPRPTREPGGRAKAGVKW